MATGQERNRSEWEASIYAPPPRTPTQDDTPAPEEGEKPLLHTFGLQLQNLDEGYFRASSGTALSPGMYDPRDASYRSPKSPKLASSPTPRKLSLAHSPVRAHHSLPKKSSSLPIRFKPTDDGVSAEPGDAERFTLFKRKSSDGTYSKGGIALPHLIETGACYKRRDQDKGRSPVAVVRDECKNCKRTFFVNGSPKENETKQFCSADCLWSFAISIGSPPSGSPS